MASAKLEDIGTTVSKAKDATADFLGELFKDSLHSALVNPYNSIVQITKSVAKETLHTDLHITTTDILKPTENAAGAKAAGKAIGEMAGTVFDYMVTMKLLNKVPGLKAAAGTSTVAEAEQLLTARKMALAGATGFTQGALFTPIQDGDSNWKRVAHGSATAASFMAMEAVPSVPGLNKLGKGFKAGLVKSSAAGSAAGFVQTEADSLFTKGELADGKQTAYATIGGALGGAAFHGVTKLGARLIENSSAAKLEPKTLTEKNIAPETVPQAPEKPPINRLQDGTLEIKEEKEEDGGLVKSIQTGKVHHPDGTDTKVVVRSLETEDDVWALQRVQHAQIIRTLHIQEGFHGTPPEIAVRTGTLDGKLQPVSVQEHGGKSFGGQVREWAGIAKGLDPSAMGTNDLGKQVSGQDIASYIAQHPTLYSATAEGIARKLVDGGLDLNLSNWTIPETVNGTANPDGPVHLYDIDPKRGFALHDSLSYGPEIKYGDAPDVVKLLENKKLSDISHDLQVKFDQLVARYTAPNGLAQMESAGLTRAESEARLARMQSLAREGFPPFLATGFPEDAPVMYMTPEYDAQAEILDKQLLAKAKSLTIDAIKK